jgi:hypothetical protein
MIRLECERAARPTVTLPIGVASRPAKQADATRFHQMFHNCPSISLSASSSMQLARAVAASSPASVSGDAKSGRRARRVNHAPSKKVATLFEVSDSDFGPGETVQNVNSTSGTTIQDRGEVRPKRGKTALMGQLPKYRPRQDHDMLLSRTSRMNRPGGRF